MNAKLNGLTYFFENNFDIYTKRLDQLVSVKSISGDKEYSSELYRMINTIANFMRSINMDVKLKLNKKYYVPGKQPKVIDDDGQEKLKLSETLPPIIFAKFGDDKRKRTLLIYCHLDIDMVNTTEWKTDPFHIDESDKTFHARGVADNKGQLLIWLCVIEAFQKLDIELPMNIKFIIDPLEESGSEGMAELLYEERTSFLGNVDDVCISENQWLTEDTPCLGYGLRGICYYFIEIICAKRNLHSGVYGGCIHEAMSDLIYLMNSLTDKDGHICVPKIYDKVILPNQTDKISSESTRLNLDELKNRLGVSELFHHSKQCLLEHRANLPSLSLHGIRGSFDGIGARTIIPHHVIGKFSIRLVPDQDPVEINQLVIDHITKLHNERSPNYCKVYPFHCNKAWVSDIKNVNFLAAELAIKRVWNKQPDYIREGASIPIVLTIQDILKTRVILLPLTNSIDDIHSDREQTKKEMILQGMKVAAAYICELGVLHAMGY